MVHFGAPVVVCRLYVTPSANVNLLCFAGSNMCLNTTSPALWADVRGKGPAQQRRLPDYNETPRHLVLHMCWRDFGRPNAILSEATEGLLGRSPSMDRIVKASGSKTRVVDGETAISCRPNSYVSTPGRTKSHGAASATV